MKIQNISNKKIINYVQFTQKHNKNLKLKYQNEALQAKAPSNPKYYHATNNINFTSNTYYLAIPTKPKTSSTKGLVLQIPLEEDEKVTLEFEEDEAKYFFKKDGTLNSEAIESFVEIYGKFYRIRKEKYKKESSFLRGVLDDKTPNKIISLNPHEDTKNAFIKSCASDPDDYIETLLSNIIDREERKNLAEILLDKCKETFITSSHTIAMEALYIIALSLNEDDIDLSNLEKKNEIAVNIAAFSKDTETKCFKQIINSSKNHNGEFDIDFCLYLTRILVSQFSEKDAEEQIKEASLVLKNIIEKDPEHSIEAIEALIEFFIKDALSLDEEETDCFMNCFNPINGEYEKDAQQILKDFFSILPNWYANNFSFDKNYTSYRNVALTAIKDYFTQERNPVDGKLKENFKSPSDFLENYRIL